MSKSISKYFWDLNQEALKETKAILKDSEHPKFPIRMVSLLSRCQQPRELFSIIDRKEFIQGWPKIRSFWRKVALSSDFRDWWQMVYEQIIKEDSSKHRMPLVKAFDTSLRVGELIREARIEKGLSQQELALRLGMKQPDISSIEKGKKNITLETLTLLCKSLGIKKIEF